MKKNNFNITTFDFETTGLNIEKDELVSLYAVNRKLNWEIDSLTKPNVSIKPELTAIHGIDDDMVKDVYPNAVVVKALADLWNESEFISGWNIAGYDVPMFFSLCDRYSVYVDKSKYYLDMKYVARLLLDEADQKQEIGTYSLVNVHTYLFGHSHDAHKAKDDVRATLRVFNRLADYITDDHILTVESMFNEVITDPNTKLIQPKHLGKSLCEVVSEDKSYIKFLLDKNNIKLSTELIQEYGLQN